MFVFVQLAPGQCTHQNLHAHNLTAWLLRWSLHACRVGQTHTHSVLTSASNNGCDMHALGASLDQSKMLSMPAAAVCKMLSSQDRLDIMMIGFCHQAASDFAMSATLSHDSCMHTTTAAQKASPAALVPLHLPLHVTHL